ncbi:MAG: hypothetical protein ABSE70_06710 [Candidatus Limnocylindrales bacterium]
MPPIVDPATLDWLLTSDEPAARWIALTQLLDRPPEGPEVKAAHRSVLGDRGTRELVGRLGDWEDPGPLSGHDSPAYAPNLLGLLADMGVRAGDDPTVDAAVGALLHHQDEAGRLATPSIIRRIGPDPVLSAVLCDSHAIVEVLIRFGQAEQPTVRRALDRMAADLTPTAQGPGWPCIPSSGFRGPGRKATSAPRSPWRRLEPLPDCRPSAVRSRRPICWRRRRPPFMSGPVEGRRSRTCSAMEPASRRSNGRRSGTA